MKGFSLTCLLAVFLIIANPGPVAAQSPNNIAADSPSQAEPPAAQTSANESFDLNITERRINQSNYKASTAVEIGQETANGVNLRVGAAVAAGTINVLLLNVTGRVRFRATLEPVLARIRAHRPPGATR